MADARKPIAYEAGKALSVKTGERTTIRVPGRRMTVAFQAPGLALRGAEFPVYVLESADGDYHTRLTPKDDLVPGDGWLQLAFGGLVEGKRYTLKVQHGPDQDPEVVFEDAPYDTIVDGAHEYHGDLDGHLVGGAKEDA
jgi:hypothetical protein